MNTTISVAQLVKLTEGCERGEERRKKEENLLRSRCTWWAVFSFGPTRLHDEGLRDEEVGAPTRFSQANPRHPFLRVAVLLQFDLLFVKRFIDRFLYFLSKELQAWGPIGSSAHVSNHDSNLAATFREVNVCIAHFHETALLCFCTCRYGQVQNRLHWVHLLPDRRPRRVVLKPGSCPLSAILGTAAATTT